MEERDVDPRDPRGQESPDPESQRVMEKKDVDLSPDPESPRDLSPNLMEKDASPDLRSPDLRSPDPEDLSICLLKNYLNCWVNYN
jgi:hypothetical protein